MARINPISVESADGKTATLFGAVEKKLGMVPNLLRTFAQSPAVLEGYLGLSGALGKGVLPAKLREQIALAVSETNGCNYCVAAHSAAGKMVGLSDEDVADSRRGASPDSRVDAVLHFARRIVDEHGWVSEDDLEKIRAAGFGDAEITEIVANVALNIFTNYFNHVADTEVDFPVVAELVGR